MHFTGPSFLTSRDTVNYANSLGGIDPQNGAALRSGIRTTSHLLPTPATGTPTADEK